MHSGYSGLALAARRARWTPPAPVPAKEPETASAATPAPWRPIEPIIPQMAASRLNALMREVCAAHKITLDQLRGPGRKYPVMGARLEYYYRAMVETDRSLCAIARAVNRDHTSVLSGVTTYARRHGLPLPRNVRERR